MKHEQATYFLRSVNGEKDIHKSEDMLCSSVFNRDAWYFASLEKGVCIREFTYVMNPVTCACEI